MSDADVTPVTPSPVTPSDAMPVTPPATVTPAANGTAGVTPPERPVTADADVTVPLHLSARAIEVEAMRFYAAHRCGDRRWQRPGQPHRHRRR
jgi:hypothetical protein